MLQVAGFKFERIGAPQPRSMAEAAAEVVLERIANIDNAVVPWFEAAAQKLLDESESPVSAVAKALAQATGESASRYFRTVHPTGTMYSISYQEARECPCDQAVLHDAVHLSQVIPFKSKGCNVQGCRISHRVRC